MVCENTVRRATPWHIRVSVNSLALAADGYRRVRDRLCERLEAIGAVVQEEGIGRIGLAADFRIGDFALDGGGVERAIHVQARSEAPSIADLFLQKYGASTE